MEQHLVKNLGLVGEMLLWQGFDGITVHVDNPGCDCALDGQNDYDVYERDVHVNEIQGTIVQVHDEHGVL